MQRNRIVTAALAVGLTIGAASCGYVIAQFVSYSGHNYVGQYQNPANGYPGYTAPPGMRDERRLRVGPSHPDALLSGGKPGQRQLVL